MPVRWEVSQEQNGALAFVPSSHNQKAVQFLPFWVLPPNSFSLPAPPRSFANAEHARTESKGIGSFRARTGLGKQTPRF